MIKSLNLKRCPKLAKSKKSLSERTWFLTEELLKSHNEKVHEQVWECPHENCQFKTKGLKSALTNHIRNCHTGKRSQWFPYGPYNIGHMIWATPYGPYDMGNWWACARVNQLWCSITCDFQIPWILSAFYKERKFKCEFCDYRGTCRGHIERHMVVHTGLKPFKCKWCDYRSNQKGNTGNHEKLYCKFRFNNDNDK